MLTYNDFQVARTKSIVYVVASVIWNILSRVLHTRHITVQSDFVICVFVLNILRTTKHDVCDANRPFYVTCVEEKSEWNASVWFTPATADRGIGRTAWIVAGQYDGEGETAAQRTNVQAAAAKEDAEWDRIASKRSVCVAYEAGKHLRNRSRRYVSLCWICDMIDLRHLPVIK